MTERELWLAIENSQVAVVERYLNQTTNFNNNLEDRVKPNINGLTDTIYKSPLLHMACVGSSTTVIRLLLAQSDIDVNKTDSRNWTALMKACAHGNLPAVQLLLEDMRVNLEARNKIANTALNLAISYERQDVIKWWIASGRELVVTDAMLREASSRRSTSLHSLLLRFKQQPEITRQSIRVELNFHDRLAADIFSLVVLHCDGYLTVHSVSRPSDSRPSGSQLSDSRPSGSQPSDSQCYVERIITSSRSNKKTMTGEDAALNKKVVADNNNQTAGNSQTVNNKTVNNDDSKIARSISFFNITSQLPMELQMAICFRAIGLTKTNINSNKVEWALKATLFAIYWDSKQR